MNNEQLLEILKERYSKLSNVETNAQLKIASRQCFDDLCINDDNDEVLKFIEQVKTSIQMRSCDISDKYDDQSIVIKIMQAQIGFFLSLYSFLVSKLSFKIDDPMKEDISSWFVDILSNLNLCMLGEDFKLFMVNFVISYHLHLATLLFDIYESIGLDIPPEIEPAGYKDEDDIIFAVRAPVVRKRKTPVKAFSLEESLKNLKKKTGNEYRVALSIDRPLNTLKKMKEQEYIKMSPKPLARAKSSASKLEMTRHKIGDKKKSEKENSAKKVKKRKSLVPETPNVKIDCVTRPHRVAVAAAKKLNGKTSIVTKSPIPDRANIFSPTTQRRLRRAESINTKRLIEQNGSNSVVDLWIRRQQDEERSLTNFSNDSFDFTRINSLSSLENSNKRTTRFRARLFDSFMSPIKDCTSNAIVNTNTTNTLSPAKSSALFSPKKLTKKPTPSKSVVSPQNRLMSPKKVKNPVNMSSPPKISALPTTPQTLKSCLKSPLKRHNSIMPNVGKQASAKRRKTIDSKDFPASVLLSPKVKQRTFLANKPPQDFCEDTMFMDTNEFIRFSGSKTLIKQDYTMNNNNNNGSPLPGYGGADNSQSSFESIPKQRVKAVSNRRLSVQRNLFDSSPSSNISMRNIMPTTRRSTIALPNFYNADPETDESNGFKC